MKYSITYRNIEWHEPVQLVAERLAVKLEKLLRHYSPDVVQLHACMERTRGKEEFRFSLNLRLPSASLYATANAPGIAPSVRQAFAEIETQLKKHSSLLRHDYLWKRKRRLRDAAVA